MANGHHKLLAQFKADGLTTIYGNPGSSEEGLLDTLQSDRAFHYVLCLQESIALAMADGHCRATGKAALVQLHTGVGLGNAIGLLYQASRGHSPLVVIAGEAGVAYSASEGQMAVDLVSMARPVTKFAARVEHSASLLRVMRRAIKVAMTPPMGPVFIALPQDVLDAENDEPVVPTLIPDTRVAPPDQALEQAARWLAQARRPVFLIGDGIARSGATVQLIRLAEAVGAEVWGVNNSEVNLPQSHPLWKGATGHMFGSASTAIVKGADAVLVVGTYLFPEVFPSLVSPFDAGTRIMHIELDPHEIAKNHPVDLAFVADPDATLARLADAVDAVASVAEREAAEVRLRALGEKKSRALDAARAADLAHANDRPMRLSTFARALAKRLPDDAILFDEALTHSDDLTRWLPADQPGAFFQTRGGSLGVAFPGAIGIKLAHPGRTVVGVSGDGGCLYTIQALWTAAREGIGAKLVVVRNGGYRLLKFNLRQYWDSLNRQPGSFPSFFDIDPMPDYVGLAAAFGVLGCRVSAPCDIAPALDALLADNDRPYLIELIVDGSMP